MPTTTYTPLPVVETGDRVYIKGDPHKAEGFVREIIHNRYLVTWKNGKTWIYARSWLVKVEEAS